MSPLASLVRFGCIGLLLVVGMLGCGPRSSTSLTVFTASSLTDAFETFASRFEAEHPGLGVVLSTAGSQALRVQIEHGAPGDVFASANAEHMQAVVDAGLVSDERVFARGGLTIVVPPDNPAGIESLTQLPRARRLILGTPEVPVGRYARTMLDRASERYGDDFRAQVEATVVSLEPNVRLILTKVELGEADAAIVYRSDASAARAVRAIEIPPELNVTAEYHAGLLVRGQSPPMARLFLESLASPSGQAALERHGFRPAP